MSKPMKTIIVGTSLTEASGAAVVSTVHELMLDPTEPGFVLIAQEPALHLVGIPS